jgi:hypothetical protein
MIDCLEVARRELSPDSAKVSAVFAVGKTKNPEKSRALESEVSAVFAVDERRISKN